jgi:hypothetical protein
MSDFSEEYTHVPLQCDNTSAISLAKNLVLHSKTKHIEVRYHFLRDNVEKGKISLIHVGVRLHPSLYSLGRVPSRTYPGGT